MANNKYPNVGKHSGTLPSCMFFLKRRLVELLLGTLIILSGQNFLYAQSFSLILWPTTGVGLAMLFLRGHFMVVPIFLGCICAGLAQKLALTTNITMAIWYSTYLWLCYFLSIKLIGPIQPVLRISVFAKWVSLLMILSIAFMAMHTPDIHYMTKMSFLAMNGILGLTPFALMLTPFTFTKGKLFKGTLWWLYTLLSLVSLIYVVIFSPQWLTSLMVFFISGSFAFSYHYGQIPTGFTLLSIGTVFIGLDNTTWQSNYFLPIFFFLLCFIGISIATLKAQFGQAALSK